MGVHQSCCQDQPKGAQFTFIKYPETSKLDKAKLMGKNQLGYLPANQQSTNQVSKVESELNARRQSKQYGQSTIIKRFSEQKMLRLPQRLSSIKQQEQSSVQQYKFQQQFKKSEIQIPQLTNQIQKTIKEHYFYESQLHSDLQYRKFDQDVYYGRLDHKKQLPHGFGKLYKNDRSYYMGEFVNGQAQGRGVYIFADGSFYSGFFQHNCAECANGQYKSNCFEYIGAFKQNLFHYQGKEKSQTYTFEGQYEKGHRTLGKLSWISDGKNYTYEGQFNSNNQFHGEGTLIEPTGTYKGSFLNGKQNEFGIYKFTNNFRYEGEYKEGLRCGKGTIYNNKNQIVFRGQLRNGMPHGIGEAVDLNGKVSSVVWDEENTSINII